MRRLRFFWACVALLALGVVVAVSLVYALPAGAAAPGPAGDAAPGPGGPAAPAPAGPVATGGPGPAAPGPAGPACAYTLLEDAPWGCRPSAPVAYATAAKARDACSASSACKGYYRAPPGYATSSSLPSECLAAGATPVEFHAKAIHAPPTAPHVPQGAWKRIAGNRVGSCGSSLGSLAQHNSTYRVCAESDRSSERCAYFASGHIDPAMCVPDPEPTYAAFVPKLGAGFGPPQPKSPPVVASCAFRTVRDEADAKCLCAADPKCAGYYRGSSGSALSVAEPGECEVDWQLNQTAIDKAKDRCSLLGPKWATNANYQERYCVPVATCAYGTNEVLCADRSGPPCPAGWTVEGGTCRPPCPRSRGTAGWCIMDRDAQPPCPRGFRKFTKSTHGELCVPTAPEIESILQSVGYAGV